MMMLGDKKKMVQLILSESPGKPEEKEVSNGLEADFSKAHEALAKEVIDGIKSDDAMKVSKALKKFYMLCEKEEEYSELEGE